MAENSAIEWTDHTFNFWEGCQKVGPGCDHCYAEARNARFGGGVAPNWGPGAPRRLTSPANRRKPLRWQAQADAFQAAHGRRQRVFCSSLADVFDNAVPADWRRELFDLIDETPALDWLLLTKRIGNVRSMLSEMGRDACPQNVWLGATVVNQAEADRDIPKLLAAPAQVRFLSMEPLLGPVNLRTLPIADSEEWDCRNRGTPALAGRSGPSLPPIRASLDWVIVGGESGPGARPMHPDWARSLRAQCAAAGVPFMFKQWGEWRPPVRPECYDTSRGRMNRPAAFNVRKADGTVHCFLEEAGNDSAVMLRVGKKAAGRLLDGVQHDGAPA